MAGLKLSRRVGESIKIDDDVWVTVIGIRGNQVKLEIDAPKDVSIMREELLDRGVTRKNGEFVAEDG